jgi:hemoglobin-like flavoprotein
MSIFNRTQPVTSTPEEVTAPVFEGYGAEVNGDIIALQESYEDQLPVIEAIHAIDMAELSLRSVKESDASAEDIESAEKEFEAVQENAVRKGVEKIKQFFLNLWGKLKAFLASVGRQFDALTKSGADFAKKYEKKLKEANLGSFKYKMHNYTDLDSPGFSDVEKTDVNAIINAAVDAVNGHKEEELIDLIRKVRENAADEENELRGHLVGKGSLDASQFSKALYGLFRGGAQDKSDAKEVSLDVNAVLAVLKDEKGKKEVIEFQKATDKDFSAAIKGIKAVQSKLSSSKSTDGDVKKVKVGDTEHTVQKDISPLVVEALRLASSQMGKTQNIHGQVFRAWKDAYNERSRVYKQAIVSALGHKEPKKEEPAK